MLFVVQLLWESMPVCVILRLYGLQRASCYKY